MTARAARLAARLLAAFVVAWVALLVARPARAQRARPELHVSVDADVVGIGDTFHVTLEALSSTATPLDPQLGGSSGVVVIGISPSSSTQMSIVNGTISSQRGLTTVWTLRATKMGSLALGPPSVMVDGTRYPSRKVLVRVVPTGQAPRRPPPAQRNPFDPFGGLFGQFGQMPPMPGIDDQSDRQEAPPPLDPRFALDRPRAQGVFLHATLDKTNAVVGEQVICTIYAYMDVTLTRIPEALDIHEAAASDFLKRSLQVDDTKEEIVGYADVGGRTYRVQLLRKSALFPLRSGDLEIGEMAVKFANASEPRRSERLSVHVVEPPIAGRPPGYAIGDVGNLSLSTDVSGRDIERDGAIGVTVTLSGTGNLPAALKPPERAGVEWLDPQITEKLAADGSGRFGGSRTFQYVVRFHRAGDVDLGDFTLPYWDPQTKSYAVARAKLGSIHVRPGGAAAQAPEVAADPLPGLPPVRSAREALAPPRSHFDDAPAFWIALGAMPLTYVACVALAGALRRSRERRAVRGASPETELRSRIQAAELAAGSGDVRALDAATARALEAATIAGLKVNVRGLVTSDVTGALVDAGAEDGLARDVESILRACEAARFSASAGDEGAGEAKERWQRARATIERLAGRT